MIQVEVLAATDTPIGPTTPDIIDVLIQKPDTLVWIDVTAPSDDDLKLLSREFAFHPLALEDAVTRHERPKLEQYNDYFMLIFYRVAAERAARSFSVHEITLFVGRTYLVLIHREPFPEVEATLRWWHDNREHLGKATAAVLLYALLDTIVDNYFPVLDAIAERTDDLEEAIFDGKRNDGALEEIFGLRKTLLALRRVVGPERDVLNGLTRRDIELLGPDTAPYFQDVYDHVLRVTDAIDTYRDLLSGSLDAYLSVVSNNLNQVMRTLTSWSIILMTLALIAGIYGMNFVNMPELRLSWGYYAALAGMGTLGAGLLLLFRRIHWL